MRDHIKELQKRSEATSLAEVFRRALALYEMVLDHAESDGKIVFEDQEGNRETLRLL